MLVSKLGFDCRYDTAFGFEVVTVCGCCLLSLVNDLSGTLAKNISLIVYIKYLPIKPLDINEYNFNTTLSINCYDNIRIALFFNIKIKIIIQNQGAL
jgi:hypothetical protein